jgi:hypothetical protein
LTLDKEVFAECLPVPRVLLSLNAVVIESETLPNTALDKDFFTKEQNSGSGLLLLISPEFVILKIVPPTFYFLFQICWCDENNRNEMYKGLILY